MAGGQEVNINGYKFKVRPSSWWRKLTGDYWPHWQASNPGFELHIVRDGEDAVERELQLFFCFPNTADVRRIIKVPNLTKGEKCKLPIEGTFLALTGDTFIMVDSSLQILESNAYPGSYQTLYVINVTAKAWVSLAIIAGLFAGLLSAIFQLLVAIF